FFFFFFSSRRRHTRLQGDWSSDVCSSDLGAVRALAQAFPVPARGGTIKFKIGISAPLELIGPSRARLVLPALVDRNFSFAADLRSEERRVGKECRSRW